MLLAFKIMTHAVQLMTIVACISYLFNKRSSQPYLFFSICWILILLFDLTMVTIGLLYPKNNNWIYNIAFPLQQLFVMYFFIQLLKKKRFLIVMSLFALFAVLNLLLWQGTIKLNTNSLAIGGMIIVLFAFFKLYKLYCRPLPLFRYDVKVRFDLLCPRFHVC